MPERCLVLPPTIRSHLFGGKAPTEYFYFLGFGALLLCVTAILIVPRLIEFKKQAKLIREEKNKILYPFSHTTLMVITSFPLVASLFKYWIFVSPLSTYTMDFVIHGYEGYVLYSFARLLIMFLGSKANLINALQQAPPSKFWAAPPFACWLNCIIKERHVSKNDFRWIYRLILQYAIVGPILAYNELIQAFESEGKRRNMIISHTFKFISALICIYGLFVLLKASHKILTKFQPHGKFFCIKLIVLVMIMPEYLIRWFVSEKALESDDEYNSEVMNEAYSAFIAMICFCFLAIAFRKYFRVFDATKAEANQKDRRCSINLPEINQQIITNGGFIAKPVSKPPGLEMISDDNEREDDDDDDMSDLEVGQVPDNTGMDSERKKSNTESNAGPDSTMVH